MTPKVSIAVVTFNQAPYIGRCLESILAQDPPFAFEVVVGDDASTDGTTDIVRRFADQYPGRVRTLLHPNNLGPFANYRATHLAAKGEYVAHIDGDDFALPGKLAAQAALLDAHPEAAAAFHQLEMVDSSGQPIGRHWPESAPRRFDLEYLLLHHPVVGHSSMMYRRGHIDNLLQGTDRFIDFRVYVELATNGLMFFSSKKLGSYTTNVGISKSNKWLPEVMSAIAAAANHGISPDVIRAAKATHLLRAALNEFYAGDHAAFVRLIEESSRTKKISITQRFFFSFRRLPALIHTADKAYKYVRRKGWIRDMKLDHRA